MVWRGECCNFVGMIIVGIIAVLMAVAAAVAVVMYVKTARRLAEERVDGSEALSRLESERAVLTERLESERAFMNERMESERAVMNERLETERKILTERLESERAVMTERLKAAEEALEASRRECEQAKQRDEEARKREEEARKRDEDRFRVIANEIMTGQVESFRDHGERRITELLDPLKQNLDAFKRSVDECYSREARERFSLQERLKELIESNQKVGTEARQLATALRGDNRRQGQWGEMVLENILSMSGLEKGREFVTQANITDAEWPGRQRPDVIVRYPDGHCVVIDSKTSLTAFMEYVEADDETARRAAGQRHVESVRRHIEELASKSYQDHLSGMSAEFVMMFIPNEAAYMAAMQIDGSLWQRAYDRRVIIVSPTHLVSALKLIKHLWVHDRQTRNALDIADAAGKMYDKFCGFVDDLERVGRQLSSAVESHQNAMSKLKSGRGNLMTRAEQLRELGAKTSKMLATAQTKALSEDCSRKDDPEESGERSKSGS